MSQLKERPEPPPLPVTVSDWQKKRVIKTKRTLNDYVEDVHLNLLEDDGKDGELYRRYLYATYDVQAVEGSLAADNIKAAEVIRDTAGNENPVKTEKLATISMALGVVLRRYEEDRKSRRQRVGGEIVPNNENE